MFDKDRIRIGIDELEKCIDDSGLNDVLDMLWEVCWLKYKDKRYTDEGQEWRDIGTKVDAIQKGLKLVK